MTSREFTEKVGRRAKRAGAEVSPALLGALEVYYRLLERWNAKINLTALDVGAGGDRAIDRLLIEPLLAARYLEGSGGTVIDVGSGGGSPALPMALARPGFQFTLVEGKARKCAFLREAARQLNLGVRVETARYEELLSRPELHEAFDCVTMRAVRVEGAVLMGLQAFLQSGGVVMLFRRTGGGDVGGAVMPPLFFEVAHELVDELQSRVVLLRKRGLAAERR